MKTKSIVYNSFVPNAEITPAISQDKSPSFKYTGYKPRYKWSDDDSTEVISTSSPKEESDPDPESDQITFQDPTSIDWSKITGYENQPIITEFQSTTPATRPRGKHVFKDPSIQVGEMQGLLDAFADAGISLRITSGTRPGARTKQGKLSNHALGRALDITPVEGQTFEDLAEAIRNSPDLVAYMKKHGYGIYDETTPEALARTGGTGAHWHLGPDRNAILGLETILKGKQGLKIPILFAKEGTKTQRYGTRKEQKRNDRVTEMILQEANKKNQNISPITGLRYEEPLQPFGQEIASFLPGVGDVIEAGNIVNDIKNKNYLPATISILSFILPANFFGGTKKLFGFKYPYFDLEYTTKSGNLIKNRGIDKEIKNTESLLAKRYSAKGNRIPELPETLNGEQISDIIQNWEPQIREVVTPDGSRASKQVGWYKHNKSNNQPLDLSIGDKNLTTKEISTEFISEETRRQMLDHEISHWLDYTFRPEIKNSEINFLVNGTEDLVKDPLEIIARTSQVKSYNKISDGSQTFTGDQYKQMFENYINDKRNPDNFISLLKQRIKDWDGFAKWANENIPLATKSLKSFLWNTNNTEEND